MNKALYPTIAIAFAASVAPAAADGAQLTCTLRSGNTVPLTIAGKTVLKGSHPLKNFDPKSFEAGPTYTRFNQDFSTYSNAWIINRYNLQVTFRTILKSDGRVVLEENGSCAAWRGSLHASATEAWDANQPVRDDSRDAAPLVPG